ncbi:hypothetical protein HMPREF1864_00180 [Peptoniphilus sp. DNF00840]|nr:hypothetical protein HMPREF1864_00180 [Peptoniphilus sp. DNF00840]
MVPKPPICIKVMIISFPKTVHWVAVLATMSPVTHEAEVDVKRAFKNPMDLPFADARGRFNKIAPNRIKPKKERQTMRGGFFFNFLIIISSLNKFFQTHYTKKAPNWEQ